MVAAGESFLRRGLEALFDLGRHVLAKGFDVTRLLDALRVWIATHPDLVDDSL